jgi:hypothetical protein
VKDSCLLYFAQPRINRWSELVTRLHLSARGLESEEKLTYTQTKPSFATGFF